jgi:hypothetical protein
VAPPFEFFLGRGFFVEPDFFRFSSDSVSLTTSAEKGRSAASADSAGSGLGPLGSPASLGLGLAVLGSI